MKSLVEAIEDAVRSDPEREAIVRHPGGPLTYRDWWDWSSALAALLPDPSGFSPYLAFRVREPWELPLALLAAWRKGMAVFPLAPDSPEEAKILRQAGPPTSIWDGLPSRPSESFPGNLAREESPALLLHTSGTTADPKVFLFCHRQILAAAEVEKGQAPGRRRILVLRPPFTSGGTNALWPAFLKGETLLYGCPPYDKPHEEALRGLTFSLKPDLVIASPAYLRAVLLSGAESPLVEKPTTLYYGGARLKPREAGALQKLGLNPVMRYGMTECAHLLSIRQTGVRETEEMAGNVGRPFPEVEVAEGETLHFRAPGFAPWRLTQGRQEPALGADGWFRSDDHGHLLHDGSLFLQGRDERQFVSAGFRISSAEVEDALSETSGVKDVVVLGLPDPLLGEAAAALVVCDDTPGWEETLRQQAERSLSTYKRPKWIVRVEEIPATASGKRHWRKIRALFANPEDNVWSQHFALWKLLREPGRFRGSPLLARLALQYRRCLTEPLLPHELEQTESLLEEAGTKKGKHSLYQAIWGWNALAFQYFRFQEARDAARCLEKAFSLIPSLGPGSRFGRQGPCVEAVWLILLLNSARLSSRTGALEEGRTKLQALKNLLLRQSLDLSVFGEGFARAYRPEAFHFSWKEDLTDFLNKKIQEEEDLWLP